MYRIEEFLFFPFFKPDRIYLSKSFFFRTFLSPVFPPPYFMLDWTFYWPRKEDSLTSRRRRRGNLRVRAPGNFLFSCRRSFGIYKTLYPTNWNYTFLRNSQFKRICLLSQTYFVLVIKVVFSLLILREQLSKFAQNSFPFLVVGRRREREKAYGSFNGHTLEKRLPPLIPSSFLMTFAAIASFPHVTTGTHFSLLVSISNENLI